MSRDLVEFIDVFVIMFDFMVDELGVLLIGLLILFLDDPDNYFQINEVCFPV